jgi:membrane protease YdiL (CAAX protease family)
MHIWLKSLSYKAEFAIVILIGFGYFILGSIAGLMSILSSSSAESIAISNADMYVIAIYEVIAILAIASFLSVRDWSLDDFNIKISIRLTGAGILLASAYYAVYIFTFMLMSPLMSVDQSGISRYVPDLGSLDLTAITLVSMINPVYEEVIVVGYVIAALRTRKSAWFAINVSVVIRLLYHVYQGPLAAVSIIPLGLLFAIVYIRTEKLWPLIVAHGIIDFIGLVAYSRV